MGESSGVWAGSNRRRRRAPTHSKRGAPAVALLLLLAEVQEHFLQRLCRQLLYAGVRLGARQRPPLSFDGGGGRLLLRRRLVLLLLLLIVLRFTVLADPRSAPAASVCCLLL